MVKILVICVDRDNDIGEMLGVEGPIIGREKNLEVAKNLALKDPEESCLLYTSPSPRDRG